MLDRLVALAAIDVGDAGTAAHEHRVRVQSERTLRQFQALLEPAPQEDVGGGRAGEARAVLRAGGQRPARHLQRFLEPAQEVLVPAVDRHRGDGIGQQAERFGIARIELDGLAQQRDGALGAVLGLAVELGQRAQEEIVGAQVLGRLGQRAPDLQCPQARRYGGDHVLGDVVLQGEDVAQAALVAVGPDMSAGPGLDELGGDTHAVSGLAHAALDHIAHAELASHLLDVDGAALVGEAGIARDHEQPGSAGERGETSSTMPSAK